MDFEKVKAASQAYSADMNRFLRDMISHPSESCEEKDVVMCIKAEMEKLGYDKVEIDGLGGRHALPAPSPHSRVPAREGLSALELQGAGRPLHVLAPRQHAQVVFFLACSPTARAACRCSAGAARSARASCSRRGPWTGC